MTTSQLKRELPANLPSNISNNFRLVENYEFMTSTIGWRNIIAQRLIELKNIKERIDRNKMSSDDQDERKNHIKACNANEKFNKDFSWMIEPIEMAVEILNSQIINSPLFSQDIDYIIEWDDKAYCVKISNK